MKSCLQVKKVFEVIEHGKGCVSLARHQSRHDYVVVLPRFRSEVNLSLQSMFVFVFWQLMFTIHVVPVACIKWCCGFLTVCVEVETLLIFNLHKSCL